MQDVSYEPLMLQLPENPQASLEIFSQPHHHPFGSCSHRKAINKNKPLCPVDGILLRAGLPHAWQNGFFLFIALARMVTFCKEGGGRLLVWALRACSYKTRAEA